jgi:hypothetical protein
MTDYTNHLYNLSTWRADRDSDKKNYISVIQHHHPSMDGDVEFIYLLVNVP